MKTFIILFPIFLLLIGCQRQGKTIHQEGYIMTADNVVIYYEKIGNGLDIIIIPSGMYLSESFKQLANKDRTLVFYDQRGRGKSSTIFDSLKLGVKYEISDIEVIRQYFDFKKISLIGWSYSGGVAALYSNEYPSYIERLIQIGPIVPRKDPYWNEYLLTLNSRRDSSFVKSINEVHAAFKETGDLETYIHDYYEIAHQSHLFHKGTKEYFREDFYTLENERPDIMWEHTFPSVIASFGDWDFRDKLSNVEAPVLIIHGDFDAIPVEAAKEWNKIFSNSRLLILKDAGHLPWFEKPEIVFAAIDNFLIGDWPEGSIK